MATWYLDQEGGNDANAGTSFALRKKTLQSIAAAGWAAGDTVRVMASPTPTSLGVNGTWTNGGSTITLASAVTKNVDVCDSGWVGATNVTLTHSTTSRRQGTASAQGLFATAFTTGLAMYKALGAATDFSAYQQICFYFFSNATRVANSYTVRLCSDAAGVTAVHTFNVPALTANVWHRVVVNNGSALSSSIQSVAVYAETDPGTNTIRIDNIFVSKAPGAADELTLWSLISKNDESPSDEPFLSIGSISETTITFNGAPADTVSAPQTPKYYGTTQTTTAYVIQPILLTTSLTYSTAPTGDTNVTAITVEGGYNRTDMTTIVGKTYMRRDDRAASVVTVAAPHGIVWKNLGACFAGDVASIAGFFFGSASGRKFEIIDCDATGCSTGFIASVGNYYKTQNINCFFCYYGVYLTGAGMGNGVPPIKIYFNRIWGPGGTLTANTAGIATNANSSAPRLYYTDIKGNEISNVYTGIDGFLYGQWRPTIRNINFTNVIDTATSLSTKAVFWKTNHTSGTVSASVIQGTSMTISGTSIIGYYYRGSVGGVTMRTATDQRRTASDVSWRVAASASSTYAQTSYRLCRVLCSANNARTVTVWAYRTDSNVLGRIRVKGGYYAGIPSDITDATTGSLSTWEQLSITFTPTENCVIDVFMECNRNASATYLWFDDLEVS